MIEKIKAPSRANVTSPCHRAEQPAFDGLESKDGQVRCDDDTDCVEDGPLHLMGCFADLLRRSYRFFRMTEMANNVLDHHDCPINYHAKVQRAQREQVRRDMAKIQGRWKQKATKTGS